MMGRAEHRNDTVTQNPDSRKQSRKAALIEAIAGCFLGAGGGAERGTIASFHSSLRDQAGRLFPATFLPPCHPLSPPQSQPAFFLQRSSFN